MNRYARQWGLFVAAIGVLVIAGCSSKQSESKTPAASSQPTPEAAAPSGEAEHGDSTAKVTPAGTVGEIWTQVSAEQDELAAAIQNGQLADVHHLAFGIRDLVVVLADKAKAASPAADSRLDGLVEQVKDSATKLDALGDAGNLSGTQAEFAKLNSILTAINGVTGGK